MDRLKKFLSDGALWFVLVFSFCLIATLKIIAEDVPTCSYTYSSWGECQANGKQTRAVDTAMPDGCSGTPETERDCTYTPPTCSYTYSSWGACQTNNKQTRSVESSSPSGCTGSPELERGCTYVPPTCSFTYSAWNACQTNNMQTRSVQSATPSGCTGTPVTSQSCTYSGGESTCSFTYSAWNACQTNNMQTRTVLTAYPTGCTGGTPELTQSCTYSGGGTTCTFTYSSWGACQTNNMQTRSVQSATPSGCTGTPITSQSCTYSGGGGNECYFTYSSWGACQTNNMQTRSVQSATPSGCTGTPVTSQSCTYSGGGGSTCSFTYSAWNTCQTNGTQTRTVLTAYPTGCTGGTPELTQSCTYSGGGGTTACSFTYSSWGDCQSSGIQTRSVQSATPSGCTGTPVISQSCTYSGGGGGSTACAYTYSSWSECRSDGKQTRNVLTATPSGCTGTPELSRSCTYNATAPICSFTYGSWSDCFSSGIQTRPVVSYTPSGCTGSPETSRSCTYVSAATQCSFTYSSWGECKSNGSQTRSVLTATPSGCIGNPEMSQSCTYVTASGQTVTAPACSYTYSAWGSCLTSGYQMRTVISYSPSGCTGSPVMSQPCTTVSGTSSSVACSYTYSSWGLCQSNGMQTRAVLSQSPSSCSGNPVSTQSCVYTPTSTTANTSTTSPLCAYTYSSWGICQSSGSQTRSALTKTPSNCTGDPVVSQYCTYVSGTSGSSTTASSCAFSYTPWSDCQSTGMQTRAVISQTPYNCAGTPVLSQACAYSSGNGTTVTAPTCAYVYTPWIECQPNGVQMRSVSSQTPSVCVGTPEISRSCSYSPSTAGTTSTSGTSATISDFTFQDISVDNTFSGNSKVKGIVSGASGVEYFLINPATNVSISLGMAEQSRENLWERSFDSMNFPNGPFYLMAKVKVVDGIRESGRVKIVIANNSSLSASTESVSVAHSQVVTTVGGENQSGGTSSPETIKAELLAPIAVLKDFRGVTNGKWQKTYFGSETCSKEDFCSANADPDKDGLVNQEEYRFNTNPLASDTDSDGFSDGQEVTNGFNPLMASHGNQNDKMIYENPKESGVATKDIFDVSTVEVVSSETNEAQKGLKLSGKGPANTLINVFVYSELPTVLTVKTDADGNWSYTLDKNLDDGEHQVYVAVTDNSGKIAAKSEPLAFVKTAEAATILPPAEAQSYENSASPTEKRKTSTFVFIFIAVIFTFLMALSSIGFFLKRKRARTENERIASSKATIQEDFPETLNDDIQEGKE